MGETEIQSSSFSLCIDDLENEIWIDAFGFDGVYHVSNLGRVKTLGRWVKNGSGERWVKEKIRKLHIGKDGRITMLFNYENKQTSVNLPAIIYFSFNPDKYYLNNKYCIAHINKIKSDNRLENLILIKVTDSHKINNLENLLPHLQKNNQKRKQDYNNLTHKTCKLCNEEKQIERFEFGRNTCLVCRGRLKKDEYIKQQLSISKT